jgi:hypothetical protein
VEKAGMMYSRREWRTITADGWASVGAEIRKETTDFVLGGAALWLERNISIHPKDNILKKVAMERMIIAARLKTRARKEMATVISTTTVWGFLFVGKKTAQKRREIFGTRAMTAAWNHGEMMEDVEKTFLSQMESLASVIRMQVAMRKGHAVHLLDHVETTMLFIAHVMAALTIGEAAMVRMTIAARLPTHATREMETVTATMIVRAVLSVRVEAVPRMMEIGRVINAARHREGCIWIMRFDKTRTQLEN